PLVVQGLGLVPLTRMLGIPADATPEQERNHARQVALQAALARLDALASEDGAPESSPGHLSSLAHLRSHYEDKLRQVIARRDGVEEERDTVIYQRIQTDVLNAERAAVIHLRDQDRKSTRLNS